jgi:hypothetical protein
MDSTAWQGLLSCMGRIGAILPFLVVDTTHLLKAALCCFEDDSFIGLLEDVIATFELC